MSFYQEMQDVATELITEFGSSGILKQQSTTLKDVTQPWLGKQETFTDYPIIATEVPISEYRDCGRILSDDIIDCTARILIEVKQLTVEISQDDIIDYNGKQRKIKAFVKLDPAGIRIYYDCWVK